ncbi:hypothetical protein RRF57_005553 [Xylaria bambusicola]|uniref:C2H2-type domain-containing protein n=1 Tax=Xylaria bambusicola TaxID=326684 RepID=A0AAN7UNU2_9PEZI
MSYRVLTFGRCPVRQAKGEAPCESSSEALVLGIHPTPAFARSDGVGELSGLHSFKPPYQSTVAIQDKPVALFRVLACDPKQDSNPRFDQKILLTKHVVPLLTTAVISTSKAPMSQKKQVSSRHNEKTLRAVELFPQHEVWFCYECKHGPMNNALDEICVNCGRRRCSFSKTEWVLVGEKPLPDISGPGFQKLEALPKASHVIPHNDYDCSHRAATPLDHAESAISSDELTFAPLPLNRSDLIGTDTSTSTNTQSQTSAQQSGEFALGEWNLGIGLVPIPLHEHLHDSLSSAELTYNYAIPHQPTGSPQVPGSLCQLTTTQHASGDACSVVNIQYHSAESKSKFKRKYIAVDNAATTTSSRHQIDARVGTICCESDGNQRLACPFYKYYPQRHWKCLRSGFDSIGHLRQHLKDKHKLGSIHCSLCWLTFDTAMSLASHAQDCKLPTGGVPVNKLPAFPRTRLSKEKKWRWCCKKLFGEGAALQLCPFFHPEQDFGAQVQARNPGLPHQLIRKEFRNERPNYIDFAEEEECSNSSKSPDWYFAGDDNLLNIAGHITNRLPNDLSWSSDASPPDSLWNLGFEI